MSEATPELVDEPSPAEMRDPLLRAELRRASVWLGLASAIALVVLLVQPLLIIFAGLVFASLLDGGVRLLGRVLKIGRGWRLLIVALTTTLLALGLVVMTGYQLTAQVSQLRERLSGQAGRVTEWLSGLGVIPGSSDINGILQQALGSVGRLTSYIGTAAGALTSLFMIIVLGLFIAMEPRLYERGLQWMIPRDGRAQFAVTLARMGKTMRSLLAGRLIGMAIEGALTWLMLLVGGVPLPALLGIIAGLLAFIPNIGAFITGVLMVAVGFSAGTDTALWAFATYVVVQTFDGYVVVPIVARKTVDLPPALTLGAQILASALFGVLGLALADPMTAMIKVALDRGSEREAELEEEGDANPT